MKEEGKSEAARQRKNLQQITKLLKLSSFQNPDWFVPKAYETVGPVFKVTIVKKKLHQERIDKGAFAKKGIK